MNRTETRKEIKPTHVPNHDLLTLRNSTVRSSSVASSRSGRHPARTVVVGVRVSRELPTTHRGISSPHVASSHRSSEPTSTHEAASTAHEATSRLETTPEATSEAEASGGTPGEAILSDLDLSAEPVKAVELGCEGRSRTKAQGGGGR
jgi:hypothetical protein